MSDLVSLVDNYLKQNNIKSPVLSALSGGVDSVVLTYILSKLNLKVIAIHLNHNWRGEESLRDENFAREFADKIGVEFYCEKLSSKINKTELDARQARYDFFEKCCEKFASNAVFLAHNKNDNAETLLYRVIKGTGLKGLCSIPKNRDIYHRPLLDVSREEIEKFAKDNSLDYIQDSSNDDVKYARNLIRKQILPEAKKINQNALNSLVNLVKLSNMHWDIVQNALCEAKKEVFFDGRINLEKFKALSVGLKYEIINDFLYQDLKYRDFERIKSYVDFIETKSGRKSINSELFLEVSCGWITKVKKEQNQRCEVEILGEGEYSLLDKKVSIKKVNPPKKYNPKSNEKYVNLDFSSKIVLRTRKDGDVFSPFGLKGHKLKLKDYLINEKIPRQKRDNLLLLACGSEVLCILGYQISSKAKVVSDVCYKVEILE